MSLSDCAGHGELQKQHFVALFPVTGFNRFVRFLDLRTMGNNPSVEYSTNAMSGEDEVAYAGPIRVTGETVRCVRLAPIRAHITSLLTPRLPRDARSVSTR